MATARVEHTEAVRRFGFARAMLNAFDSPALLVQDPDTILAANAAWTTMFADADNPSALPSVSEWLATLGESDSLVAALGAADDGTGPRTARVSGNGLNGIRRYEVRVTSNPDGNRRDRTHCVVMVDDTRNQMNRLLVRQTLIEERERRRLGRALHDRVTQLLVQVRRQLADTRDGRGPQNPGDRVADVDRVIHLLHEITSNFSPPVLEDLGLLPAMHWLADHLQQSHGAAATCVDDGVEPGLTSEARTIAFRALRELANNAVKHAPGASIRLRASVENTQCRLEVCDDGPGFALGDDHVFCDEPQPFPGYGLLSIEQQIRAVGGTFEIRSKPGEGTRAVITLDCSHSARNKEQDDA